MYVSSLPDNAAFDYVIVGAGSVLMDQRLTWPFKTEPQKHLNGKEQLWVRGVANLRVVDSSIFPTIPSSNTNAASLAAGEKART